MGDIQGIPFSEAEFDKDGTPLSTPTVPAGTTDLIVVSHGWNNDRAAAESLYRKLFANFATVTAGDAGIARRKIAIVGVIWPSRQFDQFTAQAEAQGRAGASGAASIGSGGSDAQTRAAMVAAIDRVAPLFDDAGDAARLATLRSLVGRLDDDDDAQASFVATLRSLLAGSGDATGGAKSRDDGAAQFFGEPAQVIFAKASQPLDRPSPAPASAPGGGDGVGRAAGFGDVFSKAANAVANLLNLTTYFEMKKRAGTVGQVGVAPLVDALAPQVARIHLVGHSFGGRVVTAAAANSKTPRLASLSLLQAAFSHFGFAASPSGFFRPVLVDRRIAGPILVTHTKADTAVGLAYPIASRFSNDNASAIGDANDEYGGIGSNGAQHMTDAEVFAATNALMPVGGAYVFKPGCIHNLDATPFIKDPDGGDAHGFVFVPEVAWAISRAIVATAGG